MNPHSRNAKWPNKVGRDVHRGQTCFLPPAPVVLGDPRLLLSVLEVEWEEPSERRGVGMLELDELDKYDLHFGESARLGPAGGAYRPHRHLLTCVCSPRQFLVCSSHIPSSAAESRGRSGRHTRERRPTAVWSFESPANIVWGVLGVPLYLDLLLDRRLVGQEVEIVERIAPRLWDAAPGAPVAHVAARVHGAGGRRSCLLRRSSSASLPQPAAGLCCSPC